jgi:hypothetical protein
MNMPASVDVCPNCQKPVTKHRPWCADVQTTTPPQQGDIVDHPLLGRSPLISVYTRREAIEDGILVDCSQDAFDELNRQAGLKFDVAMTASAFDRYVAMSDELKGTQDLRRRYLDVVWMFHRAALKAGGQDELLFEFYCIPNGEGYQSNEKPGLSPAHRLVTLKVVCDAGDRGEPCLTFMLPDED